MACWGEEGAARRAHAWHGDRVPKATPAQRQCQGVGGPGAAGTANTVGVKVLGNGEDGARHGDGDGDRGWLQGQPRCTGTW